MKKRNLLFIFLICIFILSCTIKTHYILTDKQYQSIENAEKISIFSDIPKDLKFEIIGCVAVDSPGDMKQTIKAFKEEAGSIGANAVINVKLTKLNSYTGRTGLSGTAIYILK